MTLNQLKVFVLVVRLGSFRAAASALGVSEPAVSQALSALRQSLGDQLVRRTGPTLTLTAAGQRVVGLASQMVNLAVAAEDAVRAANGDADLLRVVASANVADSVAPALLQAFARRASNVEATLGIATSGEMQALLAERLADVALGPVLAGPAAPGVVSEPLLRYRLLVVAGHAHPVHRAHLRSLAALRHEEWLVDPTAADPESDLGRLLAHIGVPEANVRVFPTQPAAWASAATGAGIAPAIEHLWIRDPHPGAAASGRAGDTDRAAVAREHAGWRSQSRGGRPAAALPCHVRRHPGHVPGRRRRPGVAIPPARVRDPLELTLDPPPA